MEKKDAEIENLKAQFHGTAGESNQLKLEIERLSNQNEDLQKTSECCAYVFVFDLFKRASQICFSKFDMSQIMCKC